MNFVNTIRDSVYSPKFYQNITKKTFKQSVGYFLLLAVALTIIQVILLIQPLAIVAPAQIKQFAADVVNCYPKDLEVNIKNGLVSTTVAEPYVIPSCKSLSTKDNQNLVVIDTKTPYSPEKFAEYKVEAWLTKDSLVYKSSNVETRTYSLKKVKDFKLNREVLNSYYNNITPWFQFIGPVLLLLALIGIYLSYGFRLIQLLIAAALIWLISKGFNQNLTYGHSYKLSLFAVTLGLIAELVLGLTGRWTQFFGFPFMVTILTLGVVIVNLFLPKKAT